MNYKYYLVFILLFVGQITFAQTYCTDSKFEATVHKYLKASVPFISCDELDYNKENYVILDTREFNEYKTSHIPGAIYVGYNDFDIEQLSEIEKDTKLVVYCSIGYRSEKIGEQLQKAGYVDVSNLFGSIFEWVNQERPIVSPSGHATSKIHSYNKKWSKWISNENLDIIY